MLVQGSKYSRECLQLNVLKTNSINNQFIYVGPRNDSLVWLKREEKTSYAIKSNAQRGH